jgi:branched-chain amino acid transport system permease protein
MSAFVVSSFLTGVSGALYASYLSFATPGQWSLLLSVQYVAAIIVGGIGTVSGALLGSIVIFALPAVLQSLIPQSSSGGLPTDDIASIAYGVLIIVFFVLEPRGVVGLGRRVASLWTRVSARAGKDGGLSQEAQAIERREVTWAR